MSFERPTLTELIEQAESEIATRLGTGPLLPRGPLHVLARVLAGLTHSSHGHLDYLSRQVLPDTASVEFLERHASLKGVTRKAAVFSTGLVTFTGTDGSQIRAGARMSRIDGRTFETVDDGQIVDGVAAIRVLDTSPGSAGDTAAGAELQLVNPVEGVDATAIADLLSAGADQESDAELRRRVLAVWKQRPAVGTEQDYEIWALQVPGVTRAFARGRFPTLGQVTVYVVADDSTEGPEPTADQLAEVQAALEAQRPIVATVTATAPEFVAVPFLIDMVPLSAETQADAASGIAELLRNELRPGETLRLSRVSEVISAAAGEVHHRIVSPIADVETTLEQVLTLGDVSWS